MARLIHKILFLYPVLFLAVAVRPALSTGAVIPATQVKDHIQTYVDDYFKKLGKQYQMEWLGNISEVRLLEVPDSIAVSHSETGLLVGQKVLKIAFFRQNHPLRSLYVSVKLHVFQKVWVAEDRIERDHPLSAARLKLEEKDLSSIRGIPLEPDIAAADFYARKTISAGKILMERDVRESYAVRKGSHLNVKYESGPLLISLQAQALQNGFLGDVIWVKYPDTRKRMQVKIIGEELAVLP